MTSWQGIPDQRLGRDPGVPADMRFKARPPVGRWVSGLLAACCGLALAYSFVTNRNFQWNVVGQYLFSTQMLTGLARTLALSAGAMLIGVFLGTALAIMRRSDAGVVSGLASLYIWLFRGTPVFVQLIFWYNLSSLYPYFVIGVPFTGMVWLRVPTNSVISPLTAALLGLGLNQAAYTAEVVRGGILSVPKGQIDSATSLGMTKLMTMRRVTLPQAMRTIIPPLGNETIGMLKTTSLVSVLAIPELLYSAEQIYARTYETIPLLMVASIWYLLITSVLTMLQVRLERRFSRGVGDIAPRAGRGARAMLSAAFSVRAPTAAASPAGEPDKRHVA